MTTPRSDRDLLARAVALATTSAAGAGGPFGAVLHAANGDVLAGTNRVTETHDPTAHAEVVAIRAACSALGTFDLTGAVLYSSCEPCPMCRAAALWARIDRVVFAADRHDAAAAGFDDAVFYEYFEAPERRAGMPVDHLPLEQAREPFAQWHANEQRVEY